MNKIIRKLLISLMTLVVPITLFSCNDSQPVRNEPPVIIADKPDEYYENQLKEMYEDIYQVYEPLTKKGVFAPKEWLEEDQKTIKEQYKQKDIDTFNITFFSNFPPYLDDLKNEKWLQATYVQITTKEQFDTYIIKRFKELNQSDEYNNDLKIKKLFEELYLNKQDAYELLENNVIFIKRFSGKNKSPVGGFIIPIYDNNEVIITSFGTYPKLDPSAFVVPTVYRPDPSRIWEVFLIKKGFKFTFKDIARDFETTSRDFRNEVHDWYKNVFLKHYLKGKTVNKTS